MNRLEHWMHRSAESWAFATRAGRKYPRSRPSFSESCVSIVDAIENSMKRANSPGWNRPNPSAMFFVLEAAESRIWSRNLKSLDAAPSLTSAYTSRFSSSASCHTSKSWYRLTPAMGCGVARAVPDLSSLHRTSNPEPRTVASGDRTSAKPLERQRSLPNVSEASRTAAKPPERERSHPNVSEAPRTTAKPPERRRSLPNESEASRTSAKPPRTTAKAPERQRSPSNVGEAAERHEPA